MHPRDAKMRLAREIVKLYHGEEAALKAEEEFIKVFQKKTYQITFQRLSLRAPRFTCQGLW